MGTPQPIIPQYKLQTLPNGEIQYVLNFDDCRLFTKRQMFLYLQKMQPDLQREHRSVKFASTVRIKGKPPSTQNSSFNAVVNNSEVIEEVPFSAPVLDMDCIV